MSDGTGEIPSGGSDDRPHGYSDTEKLLGLAAAYKAPVISSVAASALLRNETDPIRREQLLRLRKGALIWAGVGVVAAVIMIVLFAVFVTSNDPAAGPCRGGPDTLAIDQITYVSRDGVHWTGTFPCVDGGSTTMPANPGGTPGLSG